MSAEIILFVPKPNPKRKSLEEMAFELMDVVFPAHYHDTAPSEYVAPLDDPA
jgi:hypothetical protein